MDTFALLKSMPDKEVVHEKLFKIDVECDDFRDKLKRGTLWRSDAWSKINARFEKLTDVACGGDANSLCMYIGCLEVAVTYLCEHSDFERAQRLYKKARHDINEATAYVVANENEYTNHELSLVGCAVLGYKHFTDILNSRYPGLSQ